MILAPRSKAQGVQAFAILQFFLLRSEIFPDNFFVSHIYTLAKVAVRPETTPLFKVSSSIVQIMELPPKEIFLRPGGNEFSRKTQLTTNYLAIMENEEGLRIIRRHATFSWLSRNKSMLLRAKEDSQ